MVKPDLALQVSDLSGRFAVVTGANSDLGYGLAKSLAIAAIGPQHGSSFDAYNTTNPHDDGISLDTFVDWIIAAGYPIERIEDYSDWLTRFDTAMRALPERERAQSVLTVLDVYRQPMLAVAGSPVPGARFTAAVETSGRSIPHLSDQLIGKYLADLEHLGVLSPKEQR